MNEEKDILKKDLQKMTRGIRKQSSIKIMGFPLYNIAVGPDFDTGQKRGHAKGILAIGDIATGFIALGGIARGVIAIGGFALGFISIGGAAIGILAIGGGAAGIIAIGGGAVGYYACGGGAFGEHVLCSTYQDPKIVEFLKQLFQ